MASFNDKEPRVEEVMKLEKVDTQVDAATRQGHALASEAGTEVAVFFSKATSALAGLNEMLGQDGLTRLGQAAIDLYLTSSSLTAREEPRRPGMMGLLHLTPEAFRVGLETAFNWLDVLVSSGIISERQLEEIEGASDPIAALKQLL
jgi:hypothetical protein